MQNDPMALVLRDLILAAPSEKYAVPSGIPYITCVPPPNGRAFSEGSDSAATAKLAAVTENSRQDAIHRWTGFVITVWAVDRAGDEAAFTSFGKVDLYVNGYAVESVLPGGEKHRWSGASMASPQVVNLAAKLFAAYPRLGAAEVKKLIVDGSDGKDISGGRSIRLLNEARFFELASRSGR